MLDTGTVDRPPPRRRRLEAGLEEILVRRGGGHGRADRAPSGGEREVLGQPTLDLVVGLVGDNWSTRGSRRMPDRSANPAAQLTLMSARVVDLVAAGERALGASRRPALRRPRPDRSEPAPGHEARCRLGCDRGERRAAHGLCQFHARFGGAAHRFVNTRANRGLNLRGINARIVEPGIVRRGDLIRKL